MRCWPTTTAISTTVASSKKEDGFILQYWFFYLYNNWRSGFNGANDHEADWEMVCVYLAHDAEGNLRPGWPCLHDYTGDDLRRRWDDLKSRRWAAIPVIFVGAGRTAAISAPKNT